MKEIEGMNIFGTLVRLLYYMPNTLHSLSQIEYSITPSGSIILA